MKTVLQKQFKQKFSEKSDTILRFCKSLLFHLVEDSWPLISAS